MKTITLTLDQARSMYKKDPTMDKLILANFTKEELEKKELPKSWEELDIVKGYCLGPDKVYATENLSHIKSIFATESQAKSALAMAQLSQLMKVYNDGEELSWSTAKCKYCIMRESKYIVKIDVMATYHFLSFKSAELRDEFLENFEELIKEYFEL